MSVACSIFTLPPELCQCQVTQARPASVLDFIQGWGCAELYYSIGLEGRELIEDRPVRLAHQRQFLRPLIISRLVVGFNDIF